MSSGTNPDKHVVHGLRCRVLISDMKTLEISHEQGFCLSYISIDVKV